jgi:protein transport protein DSL1/ZW10
VEKKQIFKCPFDKHLLMDVLFNSIDIRDLLSSTDADDPSTPLSAPDLHLLIERLQVRSVHIKSRVHDYLRSHQLEFSSLFSQCTDVVLRSEQLSGQLFDLLSLISGHPADTKIKDVIQDIVSKRKDAREKKELLELLGVVLELYEKLRHVKEDIEIGKVEEAAEALTELKAALRMHDDEVAGLEEENSLVVYELLRNEWTVHFEKV